MLPTTHRVPGLKVLSRPADDFREMDPVSAAVERPLVSVIITSYNYAHYIGEAISSVLTQDFPSFELIVVDNASTDNTDDVVAAFARDARLRYIKNETNIGLTPNHNRGLGFARGDFIVFCSADDRLLPGHLRRSYDYLQAHPEIDMVYSGVVFMDAQSRPFGVRNMSGQLPVDYAGGRNEFAAQLAEGCYVPWPSMLARRSLFDELGPLENLTAADYEITVRWAAAGKRFGYLRAPSVSIRLHGPQASGASYVADGRDLTDYLAILEKFVVPENAGRLQGFTNAIARHAGWRADYYRQTRGSAIPLEIAERVDAITQRLAALPSLAPAEALDGAPLISVIVRVETIPQLLLSLDALAAQQDPPEWEAVVVGEGGTDLSALLAARPYGARIRFVRLDGPGPAAARNAGIRLAAGRIITYLDPGNVFGPHHLAQLAAHFAAGAQVVRSTARLLLDETSDGTPNTLVRETPVAGLFRGVEDDDRDFVAPAVPVDAIAHLAGTVEHTGPFRADIPAGDAWEYWLRLRRFAPVFNAEAALDVRVIRQRILPDPVFLHVAQSLHRAYPAPPGSPLAARRAVYLQAMSDHLERGAAAIVDEMKAVEVLAAMLGIENAVMTATRN
jgi:glycosyltransferase involved in cell wall biosynthesis